MRQRPGVVEPLEREVGRRRALALLQLRRCAAVRADDAPDQEPEKADDGREREPLRDELRPRDGHALTMNTGVPTSTRSNSHSTSGISMRTQPCEAE